MGIFKCHFDDGLAREADVFITGLHYNRINASDRKWNALRKKIAKLKVEILGQHSWLKKPNDN